MARGVSIEEYTGGEGLERLRQWATLDLGEIARRIGITRTTLSRWCKKSDVIRSVLYDREKCEAVEEEVYKCCFDRTRKVEIRKQVLDKNGEIQTLIEDKVVVLPADFRAQKYWLNNRNPDRWRDKMEVSVDSDRGGTVMLPIADMIDERDVEAPSPTADIIGEGGSNESER